MTRAAIIGLAGPVLTAEEAALLRDARPLGVILFARNVQDPVQLTALTAAVRDVLGEAAPILVDQEGGRVARLRPPHWPAFPAAIAFADGPAGAARDGARRMGATCLAAGFDVVCAPVLDLRIPDAHGVIGDRAYGETPEAVARLGAAVVAGLLEAGVTPVVKHVPGHGRATADSHHELPRVTADAATLAADLHPFRALSAADGGAAFWAMTAHVLYPAWDAARPATLSPSIIGEVIRGAIGFDGVLVSDDIAMGALAGLSNDLAAEVIGAGCDVLLHCSGRIAESAAVLHATPPLSDRAAERLATARAAARHERFDGTAIISAGPAGPDPTAAGRDAA
ncbi:beta-N-acetylhexosaminidase [Plastoroseomonas hellenica]|uniref:beta-N-acetylhexosaminidase n=1 Tax=Plastoroseomonas hellenica TaxID=2687306 RepID=UPI001BAC4409|nr:beta-N-acetylhexosaminidase [Plastoroseomonas hellenica]MBR0647731.1 beta-N-acetylhexosaminidase [Plastoroseomonas hellenica]